jgi:hypothetical protein
MLGIIAYSVWFAAVMDVVMVVSHWGAQPPIEPRLLALLPDTIRLFCVGLGLLLLRRFLRSVFAGRPFAPNNPRWLTLLALNVFVGGSAHT